ncbi:hypothetical protein PV327_006524 [Microctonus hyperodae]|uniref:MICOS complex subunit MIC60 n=1 Tax=Microctonus hyperodae TaxID=165561 RepID=A0AA39F4J4_MICHY|nr:hypothetical protein PV327_006524 [Microctonus hyperodae]
MFRIGFKLSSNPHNRIYKIKKNGYSKIYSSIKCRDINQPCINNARLCNGIKIMSSQSRAEYSSDSPKSEKSRAGRGAFLALGSITLGTIGILTLAKNNSDVRKTLEEWIPGTDHTIKIIFQEDGSYLDKILESINDLKQSIMVTIFGDEKATNVDDKSLKTADTSSVKKAPKPIFEPLIDRKQPPVNEPHAEIRQSKKNEEKIQVVVDKPAQPTKKIPDDLKPANIVELEKHCVEAAAKAINAYQEAISAIKNYNLDVIKVIDVSGSPANVSSPIWQRLKEATEKRKRAVKLAEDNAIEAVQSLKQLTKVIDDPELDALPAMKSNARRNVKKLISDIDDAKEKYENEDRAANVTETYWNKVKAARENFNEELQILFPNINIHDKHFSVNEELFDLFVLYMYNKVIHLQTELQKLETIGNNKLRMALKSSGDLTTDEKIHELIRGETKNEKRLLQDEFDRKLLAERKLFEEELRRQLKLQAQINADHMKETIETKEREMQRIFNRSLGEQLEVESNKYKAQLAAIVGRLRGLDEALKLRLSEEKGACDAQVLWAACQALSRAIKVSSPGTYSDESIRPLEAEIKAVAKVAPKDDALVQASLAAIPEEAVKRGVFPEDMLRKRFLKVEHMARRLALVPEEGASLPIYLLSYLQNFLLIKSVNPIPKGEIEDQPIDISKLDTYDILNRARYWLDRGDFKMTLRYMNLLKGAPKAIAKDWINETRILLETQQAIDTLIAYAGAIGLVFLGSGDSTKKAQN